MSDSPRRHSTAGCRRRGTILIVTMVLVFLLAALALSIGQSARSDAAVAANESAAREAAVVGRGAEQYVLALLAESLAEGGQPIETLDAGVFEAVRVGGGYFWIVRPDYDDPQLPAFGLVDESGKIDLNAVGYEQLLRLPGMTNELAASVVDWRDEDDEVTDGAGAESQAYLGRNPGYEARNAPFETVEELLLINGMTRDLLYGPPGAAPPLGGPGGPSGGGVFADELYQTRGFHDLFTVWSDAPAAAPDGRLRLDVDAEEEPLRELVTEIIGGSRAAEINAALDDEEDLFEFALNATVTADELRRLEPYLTTGNPAEVIRGRVNVNLAPREVLLTIENLDEGQIDALLTNRRASAADHPGTMAWVMEVLDDESEGLGERLVARGSYFSADVVAVSGNGRSFRRARVVVGTGGTQPVIVYRRDLTERGWPLDPAILDNLRSGVASTPDRNR